MSVDLSNRDLVLLRRLERELAPTEGVVGAASKDPGRRSTLVRVALPTVLAAVGIAGGMLAWPHLPNREKQHDGRSISTATYINDEEANRIRAVHADAVEADRLLRAEFAKAREATREIYWYQDTNALLYRSPWRPR